MPGIAAAPGIGAIVLAAGGSSRFGSAKQLLVHEGQTLIRRAADAVLAAGCHPVVVVLGAQSDRVRPALYDMAVQIIINERWQTGIGSSIRAGIAAASAAADLSGVVIHLCDQPLVGATAIRRLIEGRCASDKSIIVSEYAGTIGPPVLVARTHFPDLLALPDDQGAKRLWLDAPDEICRLPCPEAQTDIDTICDAQRLEFCTRSPGGF